MSSGPTCPLTLLLLCFIAKLLRDDSSFDPHEGRAATHRQRAEERERRRTRERMFNKRRGDCAMLPTATRSFRPCMLLYHASASSPSAAWPHDCPLICASANLSWLNSSPVSSICAASCSALCALAWMERRRHSTNKKKGKISRGKSPSKVLCSTKHADGSRTAEVCGR